MNDEINWIVSDFADLTAAQLYEILHLRSKIFVVEQSDIYLDADYSDQKATHLLGCVNGEIVAYCRVFKAGSFYDNRGCVGRVLVVQEYRNCGFGKDLIAKALEVLATETRIQIAAQLYLQKFYEDFGFVAIGKPYLDGSVEHIDMVRLNG